MNSEIFRVGQTYSFMGYDWTACELINKGKTLVIQSHGVTHGEWPGFVMPQFGNGDYYSKSIDGEDISAYDNKMKELYDTIKDAEDPSVSYGKGLFLINKEKASFPDLDEPGSGNYWKVLKRAAENAYGRKQEIKGKTGRVIYGKYLYYPGQIRVKQCKKIPFLFVVETVHIQSAVEWPRVL